MKVFMIILALAFGFSLMFLAFIATTLHSESSNTRIRVQRKVNSEEYTVRIAELRDALEDSKEILRDTLYQQSLNSKSKNSKAGNIIEIIPQRDKPKPATVSEPPISLPGAQNHPILRLNEKEFRTTPVSELMRPYGESEGGGTCPGDFGNQLVRRWRDTKQTYCSNNNIAGRGGGMSSIDCYLMHQTRHHGNGDNLCWMRNVSLDMGIFANDAIVRPVVEHYVRTKHNDQPYVPFPRGFLEADCETKSELWRAEVMPGWNADLTVRALRPVTAAQQSSQCEEWVRHKVLIVQRDTFANFFHDSEDLVNAFLALAILQWSLADTQLYFTDLYPEGPFWSIWEKAFSARVSDVGSPLTAWGLRNQFAPKTQNTPRRVCFENVAVGIYGPAAPMTIHTWDTPCFKTALIRAYSDFVIRGLGLQGKSHYAAASPSRTVRVTYMARRASIEWPEKKFCNDTTSFFLCKLWSGEWGIRRLGRMIQNEAALISGMKTLEGRVFGNGAKVEVRVVDFNILNIEEQIEVDITTDVMVGPHGAGLTHNIFMRDRAVLVEMSVDGSEGLRHFHNLAHWYGRKYIGRAFSNPVDVGELVSIVAEAVESIDIGSY